MMPTPRNAADKLEKSLVDRKHKEYVLRLYVAGTTMRSARAIANVKDICEQYLHGSYRLEVIDLYQQPHLAHDEQIIAAPTLVKQLPLPVRRVLGDMSRTERVLVVLGLAPKQDAEPRDPEELH
jgi:circadian clock protein KaiB